MMRTFVAALVAVALAATASAQGKDHLHGCFWSANVGHPTVLALRSCSNIPSLPADCQSHAACDISEYCDEFNQCFDCASCYQYEVGAVIAIHAARLP